MQPALRMFSICHMDGAFTRQNGWIEPIAIGDLARTARHMPLRDDIGAASIAHLHPYFSELTAHYWVWKNIEKVPFVGFCHYKRYFNFIENPQIHQPQLLVPNSEQMFQHLGQDSQKSAALNQMMLTDVIASRSYCLPETIEQQFCSNHQTQVWIEFVKTVKDVSPAWLSNYLPWFGVSREFRFYPIFITRWEVFDEFCHLLFSVLFELFRKIGPLQGPDDARFHPKRYPAFLSERFMMLYFQAKGLRVSGTQIFNIDQNQSIQ